MTTIIIHRTAPSQTFSPEVTLHHLPQTWSWSNIVGTIPTSISGEKGDYIRNYDIPTATLPLSTSSKLSYQQRFHNKPAEFHDLRAEMAQLTRRMAALEGKSYNRDLADEYFSEVFMKVQIYTSIGRGA